MTLSDLQRHYQKGTVNTNNGSVYKNEGTVITNDGTVGDDYYIGTTLITAGGNYGTVTNKDNGTVTNNYGTVIDKDGETRYGTLVMNTGTGEGKDLFDMKLDEVLDLAAKYIRNGFKLIGFSQNDKEIAETEYLCKGPDELTLIWEALPNEGGAAVVFPFTLKVMESGEGVYLRSNYPVPGIEDMIKDISVKVDGQKLAEGDFTAELQDSGNVDIPFAGSFLESLAPGVEVTIGGVTYSVTMAV